MRKSAQVLLSAFFIATTSSCMMRREWVDGSDEPYNIRDTVVNEVPYRYYRGGWFRLYSGRMRVPYYMTHSSNPVVAEHHHIRAGGFGRMANTGMAHS